MSDGASAVQLRHGGDIFLLRAAGVARGPSGVLLHRAVHDDFWALPGGRVTVGEDAAAAVRREFVEELGIEVEVGDLVAIVENFFDHDALDGPPGRDGMRSHHEVGLYFDVLLPDGVAATGSFWGAEFVGTTDEFALEFRWFATHELADLDVRPAVITPLLANPAPGHTRHLVSRGRVPPVRSHPDPG